MAALHDLHWDFLFFCQMICKQHIVLNHVFFRYKSNLEPVTYVTNLYSWFAYLLYIFIQMQMQTQTELNFAYLGSGEVYLHFWGMRRFSHFPLPLKLNYF